MRVLALAVLVLAPQEVGKIKASVETDPVRHGGDAADDPAIWVHPLDPALSVVIGDDKNGGLGVWGLDGRELQFIDADKALNNVDLRYGFPLKGTWAGGEAHEAVDLVGVGNETDRSIRFYKMNPKTRRLERAGDVATPGATPYGSCMYRGAKTGRYHYVVTMASGLVEQWELRDGGSGRVAATKVRSLKLGSTAEGCVADDVRGVLYVAEESTGIWSYGAEPEAGEARILVDRCGKGGRLTADVEGLAIYDAGEGAGYLLASSQGSGSFVIYDRAAPHAYVGTFRVVDGPVDGVSDTDGIEVTSAALGPAFPHGLFVAQDGDNPKANQNYKLVPWERIAAAFSAPLRVSPRPPQR
jgi:3-phytase